jgi:lipoprotein-anchoring transpeptidase ErfK/SrfK
MDVPPSTRSGRTVYRSQPTPPRKRRTSLWLVIGLVVVAVGATAAWQFATAPSIGALSPEPGTFTSDHTVPVKVRVKGMSSLKDVVIKVNGKDVTDEVTFNADDLVYTASDLPDGTHTISVSAGTSNLYRHSIERTWEFTVDTKEPKLHWVDPRNSSIFTSESFDVTGETEPGATVTVTSIPGRPSTEADASGRFSLPVTLPDGKYKLELTVRDSAGNTKTASRRIGISTRGPLITVAEKQRVDVPDPTIKVGVHDPSGRPRLVVTVDGEQVFDEKVDKVTELTIGPLAEGDHEVVYTATSAAGQTARHVEEFVVDSTEELGTATLSAGAIGKDVRELQKLLIENGVYKYEASGVYTPGTTAAVERLQRRLGQEIDGMAGPKVIAALHGRIVVDQSECKLYFFSRGKLQKTYPVAVGQPAWPTPNGDWEVVVMAKDPTWIPPDSPWAKGLEPVPPGAGNPLGTRWIGLSASGVGIHGTPASYSIGSRASHGCIRMYIADVEELYEYVEVGMPVIIRE